MKPDTIVDGARSIVVVLYNYAHSDPPATPDAGRVAKYARGSDYHAVLARPLATLCRFIEAIAGPGTLTRPFVDAGPVPERELAQRAGLGWIAKNTMLINPGLGSFTFIASVFTTAELAMDAPFAADRCGSCTRCLDACPTAAFPTARVLDARRCISYLTIEFRGGIPPETASGMGTWVFGCDICQTVCPWNDKFAREQPGPLLPLEPSRAWIPFDAFASLDEAGFAAQYGWTPLERPGFRGMRRNVAIARQNTAETNGDGPVQKP